MKDLDIISNKVLDFSSDLSHDHPGFRDQTYRQRRAQITQISRSYKWGDALPRIQYTDEEKKVWRKVHNTLTPLYKKYACKEYLSVLPELEKHAGYTPDNIPQLADVSDFLEKRTDWTMRPVTGLLSSRDFLNSLALKVFQSTQYIRHSSVPLYTPEPDLIHEMSHAAMLADQDFSDFSQQIGLASLGASEKDIDRLSKLYWWTIEFGVCQQNGNIKAYGAGLLSSFGELKYSVSDKAEHIPFNAKVAAGTPYIVTEYQKRYFVASSFSDMKDAVCKFAKSIFRPFNVAWDPTHRMIQVYTQK